MFRSTTKTKHLVFKQKNRHASDKLVIVPKDWDEVFELTMKDMDYDDFYLDYNKDFLAWKKHGNIKDVNKLASIFRNEKELDLLLLGTDGNIRFLHNTMVTTPHLLELPDEIHRFGISQMLFLSPIISIGHTDGTEFLAFSSVKVPFAKGIENEKEKINESFNTIAKSDTKTGNEVTFAEPSSPLITGLVYADNSVTPNITQTTAGAVPVSEIQPNQTVKFFPWYKGVAEQVCKDLSTPDFSPPTITGPDDDIFTVNKADVVERSVQNFVFCPPCLTLMLFDNVEDKSGTFDILTSFAPLSQNR
jgi:hypothetical protein